MRTRTYLLLMAGAILIPVILICWAGIHMLLQSEREARLRSVEETAWATELFIEREIAIAEAALQNVANSQGIRSGDFERLHKLLSATRTNAQTWTVLSDYTGQPLFNTRVPFGAPLPNHQGKWAAEIFDGQKTTVSGVFVGTLLGGPAIAVNVPVPLSSGKRYVVSQIFDASYFNRTFDVKSLGKNWVVAIFDAAGITIARNKRAEELVGKPVREVLLRASKDSAHGVLRNVTRDGAEVYDVYTRSEVSGWTVAIGVPVAEVEAAARSAAFYAGAALAAILTLAAGVAAFFARRLSGSLRRASAVARSLRDGSLPEPVKSNVEEVDILLAELHRTGVSLRRESEARLLLEHERERLLRSEQQARHKAEAQSQAKDDFLAMLGHELRNPLSAISAAMAVIDLPDVPADKAARARAIGKRQLAHLTRIVDELLDVRRILSGKIELSRQPVNLGDIARLAVEAKEAADGGRHQWQLRAYGTWIEGDRTRIEQIVDNLLHNAMKYTPAGGRIEVRCEREGGHAVIEISDSGIGIPPDLLPRMFDVFVQGPTGIDRANGGLGIGLALVRQLTALHGGEVSARSAGPGQGSVFTLRFPAIAAPAAAAADRDAGASLPGALTVLVVEDNADAREMLLALLQAKGYRALGAADGESALALAEQEPPQVALVDIGLPGISGYQVAQRMRANPATRDVRLIALTGYGLEKDRELAFQAGFAAHIAKPFSLASLLAAMGEEEAVSTPR